MITKSRLALATDTQFERVQRRAWDSRARALVSPKARDHSEWGFAIAVIGVASLASFVVCLFI